VEYSHKRSWEETWEFTRACRRRAAPVRATRRASFGTQPSSQTLAANPKFPTTPVPPFLSGLHRPKEGYKPISSLFRYSNDAAKWFDIQQIWHDSVNFVEHRDCSVGSGIYAGRPAPKRNGSSRWRPTKRVAIIFTGSLTGTSADKEGHHHLHREVNRNLRGRWANVCCIPRSRSSEKIGSCPRRIHRASSDPWGPDGVKQENHLRKGVLTQKRLNKRPCCV